MYWTVTTPWSYSCKKTPKDAENQVEAALGAARAIKAAHGSSFTVGSLCSLTYKCVYTGTVLPPLLVLIVTC